MFRIASGIKRNGNRTPANSDIGISIKVPTNERLSSFFTNAAKHTYTDTDRILLTKSISRNPSEFLMPKSKFNTSPTR